MAKPIPPIEPLKGKEAERMLRYLEECQPDSRWVEKQIEEDKKLLRDLKMEPPSR